jgi:hypothetical protein
VEESFAVVAAEQFPDLHDSDTDVKIRSGARSGDHTHTSAALAGYVQDAFRECLE